MDWQKFKDLLGDNYKSIKTEWVNKNIKKEWKEEREALLAEAEKSNSKNSTDFLKNTNDLYKIINDKYDNRLDDNIDTLYEQILNKEELVRDTIDRVIEMKETEKLDRLFTKKSLEDIVLNIFKILNSILEETNNTEKITFNQFKKIIKKENRVIYIGIFFIILSIALLLIEVSDSL
tara:strand:- start:5573 stop:6103 length:531 start_codon:yes stop_codon:yes gene_type:complete